MISRWFRLAAGLAAALTAQLSYAAMPTEQQVRQLLQTIGLQQNLQQMNTQMALMMHDQEPCVPGSYWQNFVDSASSEQLISKMVPIYQQHFTADDIDGLNRFYGSDLGHKMLTVMPLALKEAAEANQEWARQRTAQMQAHLTAEGKLTSAGKCPGTAAASDADADPESEASASPSPNPNPIVPPLIPDTAASALAPGVVVHHGGSSTRHGRVYHRKAVPAKSKKSSKKPAHPAAATKPAATTKKAASAHPAAAAKKPAASHPPASGSGGNGG